MSNKCCQMCGGLLEVLGRLGRRLHTRCQDCGMLFSKVLEAPRDKLDENDYIGDWRSAE